MLEPTDINFQLMTTSLPSETVDTVTVIDFLQNDKHTLRACALTCKTWLHAGRFHLFSRTIGEGFNTPQYFRQLAERPL